MIQKGRQSYDIAILGGGWAGLLAAREIGRLIPHASLVVLEKATREQAGGLLRSYTLDGFTFDCGGPHLLFSKFPDLLSEVRAILEPNVVELPRKNFVSFEGQFIPYPFENGIYQLPPATRARLGTGLIEAALKRARSPEWKPANYREWVYGFFGSAIGAEYLEPYSLKIWKRPLDQISAEWVFTPGRLPIPEIMEISKAIAGIESVGYREQASFLYPKRGGIYALYRALLELIEKKSIEVRFGTPVTRLFREGPDWIVNDEVRAPVLVSTLPLPVIADMVRVGTSLSTPLPEFDYNRVLVVGVALDQTDPNQTAVYVPHSDVSFHRYTWMSYLNRPEHGGSNLIAEVTIPRLEPIDTHQAAKGVIEGLERIGAIQNRKHIISVQYWDNEFGYPIYTIGATLAKQQLLEELRDHGLYSVGRWGSWEYWNTDMVLRAVKATVKTIAETVFRYTDCEARK